MAGALSSMTGYARSQGAIAGMSFAVELKSVNGGQQVVLCGKLEDFAVVFVVDAQHNTAHGV